MTKHKLTILERITLLQVLPQEGNHVTLKVVRDASDSISLKDAEFSEYKIVQTDGIVKWDPSKDKLEKEIEIGEHAENLINEALTKLDRDKKLTQAQFTLYEKFVTKGSG